MQRIRWILIILSSCLALVAGYFVTHSILSQPITQNTQLISNDRPSGALDRSTPRPTPDLAYPTIILGKVIAIADGDTVTVLTTEHKQYRIRLAGIDAPESKQDFGQKSRQNLSDLIFGKTVKVNASKLDKYGRTIGQIFVDGKDACLAQIEAGLAWHYRQYQNEQPAADRKLYAEAEDVARKAKRGLWLQPNPVAPWDFRHPENSQ